MSANDYTPTTHYLRDIYCNHVQGVIGRGFNDDLMHKDAHAEFDRWLAEVKADAWQEGYTAGKPYPQLVSKNPYWQESNG